MNKNTASNLIKIANALDLEGEFDKADQMTELIERVASGDKEAIRLANAFGDWWSGLKGNISNVGQGVSQVGQGLWNTAKGVGGVAGNAVTAVPAAIAGGTQAAIGAVSSAISNAIDQAVGSRMEPIKKQQMVQQIQSILSGAIAAHKQGQNGWSVLNASISNLPPNVQNVIKQQFMQSVGKYTA